VSDAEIRELERAVKDDPSDAHALEALAAARTRAGRGWADEPLASGLRCSPRERGVYVWTRHGLGLEMVRVPGAATPCRECCGRGWNAHQDAGGNPPEQVFCDDCDGTGGVRPFLVGRYPVTWREWLRCGISTNLGYRYPDSMERDEKGGFDSYDDHPVVNVTHADALAFCDWAGLRLPTVAEWQRAAGVDTSPESCPDAHTGKFYGSKCPQCVGRPCVGPRPYPWGNEPPTPERCVSAERDGAHPLLAAIVDTFGSGTRPVRDAENRPARPDGASPCGAMDMAGHVCEWAQRESVPAFVGSSFRRSGDFSRSFWISQGSDDIGFRVALSESGQ
jgi:formylglycine-generating enzyme required for sulfatase activity